MKRNSKRRLLSLFLVFVLCLSMIPTPALAEETTGNNTCQHEGGWTDGKCNDCGFECQHEDANVIDGECTVCGSVVYTAQNTTTGVCYKQLAEALNQTSDGDTVMMLRDTEKIANVLVYDKSITLNLNGKNCIYGFIYIGNDNKGEECGGALKVSGKGNLSRIVMRKDSKLDLTEWKGEIEYISCQYNAVIATKNMSGKIKSLVLHGVPDDNGIAFDGGSFESIEFMTPVNKVTSTNAGSLLADGYAFKNEDGTFVPYDHTMTTGRGKLNNVTVVKCSAHYDANGDEKCDYCNTDITSFAITVTTKEGEVYYFATEEGKIGSIGATTAAAAVEYANEHNGTLKQIKALENGAYLSVVGADCSIDLNGQTIACIIAGGPNLVVTGEGTVVTLNTESGSAKIYGGSYGEISLPVGTALGSLLPDGVGFQKTTDGAWLTEEELGKTGSNVLKENSIGTVKAVNAPITNLTITAKDIAYCDELTATATADTTEGAAAVTYKWYLDGKELSGQTEAVLTLSDDEYENVGTYTIKCVASGGGYTVIKETTVTVNPADLANATLQITNEDTLIYTPFSMDKDSGCIFDVVYELGYKGKLLSAADHTVTGIENIKYAGTYTLTVTGKGNYTGTKSIRYEVKPQVLSNVSLGNLIKIYDGTTDIPLNLLNNLSFIDETWNHNPIEFERGTDYTVEANYETPEAGDEKTVTLKVKMLNKNFIFENNQREKEFVCLWRFGGSTRSIHKAASTPQSADLAVLNDHKKTYTIELAKLLSELPAPREYGDITYGTPVVELNNYYDNDADGAKIENGILSLPIEKVDTDAEGNIGTITIAVSTTNYEDMTLTIHVKASNKPVPVGAPTLSKTTLSYGEKLSNIALSGSMIYENETVEGTFTWKNPEERPDVGTADAAWIFTPDNDEYAVAEGQTVIPVQKAVPQVTAVPVVAERVYNPSKALLDSDLTGGEVTDVNGSLVAGTWSWQNAGDVPTVDNKGYTAVFTPEDGTRYETVTRNITVTVTKATPVIAVHPTASDITSGESLAAAVLSGGTAVYSDSDNTVISGTFQWLNGSLLPGTADSNVTKYPVLFVPADTVNYETAQTEITVKVQQAPVVTSTPMPTSTPTSAPISTPTSAPTSTPTSMPTTPPSASPTIEPSIKPTEAPNTSSTTKPGAEPTIVPSAKATVSPSAAPSIKPSEKESIPNSAKMAKVNKIKLKNIKKKTVLVVIGKVNNAALYKIQYSTDKRFKKSVKSKKTSKLSCKLTKLKKGKTYWIRVCAVNGKIQGKWSKTRKIKIRK